MMTIWEKAILNMQRGSRRISISAALFADRVRVEINIVRLRIRIDEVQERIDAQYQAIGRKVDNLTRGEALPKTTEHLVQDEEIAAAMIELTDRKQEMVELRSKIVDEQASMKTVQKQAEGASE
jgi:hypothetical protein